MAGRMGDSEMAKASGMTVTLSHARNPDVSGGYWTPPTMPGKARKVPVGTLEAASATCLAYIQANALGGGNWTGGQVEFDGRKIARISYNGRAWDLADQRIELVSKAQQEAAGIDLVQS